jgi:similar to spore coat protein
MTMKPYALHETLELHEISAFKTVCLTKSKTMQALVTDGALKEILRQDIDVSSRQLQEIDTLLSKANVQEMSS